MSAPNMDQVRLRALLDAYGADPERWPEAERTAAQSLLAGSEAARAELAAAAALDATLDALAEPPAPSPALSARILAAAPRAPIAAGSRPAGTSRDAARRSPRAPVAGRVRRSIAAAIPLAAAAGLALWLTRAPAPPAPAPAPLSEDVLAELGSYGMPSDALLGVTDVEVVDADLWTDCADGGLGCLDFEALELDSVSADAPERSYS
jgi:hypothetical protein